MKELDKRAFIERLTKLYEAKGISSKHGFYSELSKRYKVSKQTPNDWFDENKGYPQFNMLIKIADDLDTSLDYLLFGTQHAKAKMIPLLTFSEAVKFGKNDDFSVQDWIPSLFDVNDAFAVVLEDESMKSLEGKSFEVNSIVVFKTQKESPKNGDLVFAIVDQEIGVFAKYVNHAGNKYLSPLNKRYENIKSSFEVIAFYSYNIVK